MQRTAVNMPSKHPTANTAYAPQYHHFPQSLLTEVQANSATELAAYDC